MAKINVPNQIIDTVSSYGKRIKDAGINYDRLVLFGSYAKNTYRTSSDIDVCVVMDDKTDEHAAQVELGKLTWNFNTRIEPHPVTLTDFLANKIPLVQEIRSHGIAVI